jgi:hypothetical protein
MAHFTPEMINKIVHVKLVSRGDTIDTAGVLKQYQETDNSFALLFEGETDKTSLRMDNLSRDIESVTVTVL